VTGYWLDDERGWRLNCSRVKNFLFSTSSRPVLGSTQPPSQWVLAALTPGVKQPGCEVDHSLQTSAKVKKTCIYTSTPPYVFMAQCLISKAQGQLYFLLLQVLIWINCNRITEGSLYNITRTLVWYCSQCSCPNRGQNWYGWELLWGARSSI
jgi:hypothetical protein